MPSGTSDDHPRRSLSFTVNSLGDAGIGSGDSGDLRYCINQANADDQANTIVFDPTVFSTPQTITLTGSQLELTDTGGTQTITGPAAGVTISGGGKSRVFQVDSGVTASLSGLTISGGSTLRHWRRSGELRHGDAHRLHRQRQLRELRRRPVQFRHGQLHRLHLQRQHSLLLTGSTASTASAPAAAVWPILGTADPDRLHPQRQLRGLGGGGVSNSGTANLTDCTLSGNSTGSDGGGVYNRGTADLTDCTVSGNSAEAPAAACSMIPARPTLTDCTVSGNYRRGAGGGVCNSGTATPDRLHPQRQLRRRLTAAAWCN